MRALLPLLPLVSAAPLRVAFIGNSYTFFNDLPSMLANLSGAGGVDIEHEQVTPGGSSIFQHANQSLQMGRDTAAMLSKSWDFVVLQDQSETPGGGKDTDDSLGPGVGRQLSEAALKSFFAPRIASAGASAVLYSTWGRRQGDAPNAACCGYGDFLSMNNLTTSGYGMYGDTLRGAGVSVLTAPCGRAFELVHNSTADPLDKASLFTCLYHHTGLKECNVDAFGKGGHPSVAGTYLIASVFYGALTGKSPVGLGWAPAAVSDELRSKLQNFAAAAVFGA
eukprot:TRINITY_DN45132_c0_g1_i1.p1 TRINITY_DN45132_c0_g1~~TRINITY_DN45132_c0_g1_i1.p1  ORF type:complete len:279 (+),score=80.44 TRINITY_DN45132_c0_g1_i1:58-894(+)